MSLHARPPQGLTAPLLASCLAVLVLTFGCVPAVESLAPPDASTESHTMPTDATTVNDDIAAPEPVAQLAPDPAQTSATTVIGTRAN